MFMNKTLWGEHEQVDWSICVAQAVKYHIQSLLPEVLITVNVCTGNEIIISVHKTQNVYWKLFSILSDTCKL